MTTRAPSRTAAPSLGPIPLFRGESGDRVRMSVMFGVDADAEPDDLLVDGVRLSVPPRHVARRGETRLWRFDFAAPKPKDGSPVSYGFAEGERWSYASPAENGDIRLVFAADTARTSAAGVADWRSLAERAEREPPHLLLLGGGVIDLSSDLPPIPADGPPTTEEARALLDAYFDAYLDVWRNPDAAYVVSRTPIVALWGVGDVGRDFESLPERNGPPTRRERVAALSSRRAFAPVMIGSRLDEPPDTVWSPEGGRLIRGFRLGTIAILALDPLCERVAADGDPAREAKAVAADIPRLDGCRRLLVMTGTPLLTADGRATRVRSRLLDVLAAYGADRNCEVTLLADGEIAHMWARGPGFGLRQLCASGRARPRSLLARFRDERRAARPRPPEPGWTVESVPMEIGSRRLALRPTWLSMTVTPAGELIVRRRGGGEIVDEAVI